MQTLFQDIWKQYSQLSPQAEAIHKLLTERGESVVNDHVAYRSIALEGLGVVALKKVFIEEAGYLEKDCYQFAEKKLDAIHLEHSDLEQPKVFISELRVQDLSARAQEILRSTLEGVKLPEGRARLSCGRLWEINYKDYQELREESEYAAWFYAFGYCANHFTVNVNLLNTFKSLEKLNQFIEARGYPLNSSGGKIKGSKEVLLEQSSTLASSYSVDFKEGPKEIPSCYYEFAKRYEGKDGKLYQGFVPASADKIFESTDVQD